LEFISSLDVKPVVGWWVAAKTKQKNYFGGKGMELSVKSIESLTASANVVAKLPFWGEMDIEALLSMYREKFLKRGSTLTKETLLELFLGGSPQLLRETIFTAYNLHDSLNTHPLFFLGSHGLG
jgi:hypothetical protein